MPVVGVGSYSTHAIEPVDYEAGGAMNIMRYTTGVTFGQDGTLNRVTAGIVPENMAATTENQRRNGNSLLSNVSFNPKNMLFSYTFDIDVYERQGNLDGTINNQGLLIFTMVDCRLSSYSFDFTPGQLLSEYVTFVARKITDAQAGA